MLLKFPAQVAATKVFEVTGPAWIPMRILCGTWNSATFTLTVDRGDGTFVTFPPSTDTGTPLTGGTFVVSANWAGSVHLGAGRYGVTIAGATPTTPIYFSMSHKRLESDDSTTTYAAVS